MTFLAGAVFMLLCLFVVFPLQDRYRGKLTRRKAVACTVVAVAVAIVWQEYAPEWIGSPWGLTVIAAFWFGSNIKPPPAPDGG